MILDELAKLKSDIEIGDGENTNKTEKQNVSKKSMYFQIGIMVLIISLVMIGMIKR